LTSPPSSTAALDRPFTVAAAASMQGAFNEIGQAFTKQTGKQVAFAFGATGALATQVEQGAPFDLFVAADEANVKRLADQGLILADTVSRYATGQIVLAASKAAGVQVASLQDLLKPEVKKIAIANPAGAPYGRAAVEALKAVGIWEQVQPKIVLGENVRQAVQFVESGNAEAGIIAQSDAGAEQIRVSPIEPQLYQPIQQALGIIQESPYEAEARAFIAFLRSEAGTAILQKYGFAVPAGQ
jgi:molybdate transport system substrate-binding protein